MKVDQNIIDEMITLFGVRAQLAMVAEEATELSLAVQKYLRKVRNDVPGKPTTLEDLSNSIIEEAADVYITMENIKRYFGEKNIQAQIDRKIARQWKRVNTHKASQ